MFVELTAAYCDTSAEELGWSMELEPQPALATRSLGLSPFLAELRLLGASHQIEVWIGPGSAVSADPSAAHGWFAESRSYAAPAPPARMLLCRETVACLPERTVPLPRTAERELPGWRYTIESEVRSCTTKQFGRHVAEIERQSADGLVGRYPGLPFALTAIVMRPWASGLWWTTWHTYPQQRQVVTTLSFLRRE